VLPVEQFGAGWGRGGCVAGGFVVGVCAVAYRGGLGVQTPPPRNSEVLTKMSRILSFVENTSVTTLDIPKVRQSRTGLQIQWNP
jgi:hypothetical protein